MKLKVKQIEKHTGYLMPEIFDTVDSTNAVARKLAAQGSKEGVAVIASNQTAGRGRLGRQFFSPDGGIYMSLVLRPDGSPQDTLFITVAAAVAAARAIEAVSGRKCEIKWVNDIYIDGKKVCGILTEGGFSAEKGRLDYAILGIGINLFAPAGGYPEELPLAGSVFSGVLKRNSVKARVIGEFANSFFAFYHNLQKKEYIKEYQSRSLLNGKSITYTKEGRTYTATVLGIDDNAQLVVKNSGETVALSTGEVVITEIENLFKGKV